MEAPLEPKIYVGDGVYAEVDNDGIRLYTDREDNGRNWIVLEPWMVKALVRFCEQHEII